MCCTCYPREENDEEIFRNIHVDGVNNHPYLAPPASEAGPSTSYMQWQGETQTV